MTWKIDKALLLAVVFMLGLGLVQVYSSSFIFATESYGDGQYFFRRQLFFVFLGIATILTVLSTPWKLFEKCGWLIWLAAVGLMVCTLVPGIGVKVGGAFRWLQLPGGFRLEPGEVLKFSIPFLVALFVTKEMKFLGRFKNWIFAGLIIGPAAVLLKQPDFGTFVITTTIVFSILFAFGLKWRYIILSLAALVPAFYIFVVNVPYRYARVLAFLDPWADPEQKGFQVIQSMLSFYSGGLWGAGLGQGQGKLFFLPEAHTDFTLAVMGEELGFMGVAFVLLMYGFIVFRGLQISTQSKNNTAKIVALGVTICLALSVCINVGVVVGLLPPKGLTLPFLSYGGSSLVSTCFGIGLLLCIDRMNRLAGPRKFHGYRI